MPIRNHGLLLCAFLSIGLLVAGPSVHADHTGVTERYSKQREVFLQLKGVLQSGDLDAAGARRDELKGYPLAEHFDYLLVRKQIERSKAPAELLSRVADFKGNKRLHRKLLGVVKNRSVKLARWQDYNLAQANNNAPSHPCDDLLAGFNNGHPKQFVKDSRELWADVGRHTGNCNKAFAMLLDAVPDVPTSALWSHTVALISKGKLKSAKAMLKYFNRRDGQLVQSWIDGYNNPAAALRDVDTHGTTVHHKKIAPVLLRRWTRKELPAAVEFWRANGSKFGFSQEEIQQTIAKYAVLAAKRSLPESKALLDSATSDSNARYWRVRLALRDKNWQQCTGMLDQLTGKEQSEPRWQYWRARCLELQGFRSAASRIYKDIAGEFEYYGFLASDRLSQAYQIKSRAVPEDDAAISAVMHKLKDDPQIKKAFEFFLTGTPWEGRLEWNNALESASKATYLAAAQLADSVGWHDRAASAAFSAGASDVLPLMYPQAYKNDVAKEADRFNIAHEFVYGVMRRESRFKSDVKSPAGAVGLMQLMPATAKQMGDDLGIKAPVWRLTDSQFNIKLGVKYLNFVLSRFDNNFALAAAAYNAGPSRVKKWMADRPVETDLWVETIPFDETRAYVQAVLFNTVVFEWVKRGEVTRLENRMNSLAITQLLE